MPITKIQLHEEVVASYADLKHEIGGFHDATFKANKNTNTALRSYQQILNLFKTGPNTGLKRILENLKDVQDAVKEDPAMNKKVLEATMAFTKLLALVKTFDFSGLKSIVESLKAIVDAQNDHLAKWAKSSTNLAWSVGPRLTKIENTQALMQAKISSLKKDTYNIKSMMTKIFYAFKGQPSSAPSSSVPTTTLAITEEPPSYTEEEKADMDTKEAPDRGKGKVIDDVESSPKLVKASSKVHPDPDTPIRVPYMIHGKMYQLTKDEIQAHLDKEEKLEQATKEAMLNKPELIKVVQEEATKAGVDPKILASAKGGQEFKKIQDAEIKVLNREHS
ncbi:hypothetical protein Tco_0343715 [Tanacetum coccineum]